MSTVSPAIEWLQARDIPYRLFVHQNHISSLEQAARDRGQDPEQVIRSILFRLTGESFIMALMPGPKQISWKNLRTILSTNRITMATDDEVFRITGYRPGAVTPFGLSTPVHILIDRSILSLNEISIGSGVRGTAVILTVPDLLDALPDYEIVELI
jgi:Cys-tRNA(Pro)/Cys-tRNA(Cys) deacylase